MHIIQAGGPGQSDHLDHPDHLDHLGHLDHLDQLDHLDYPRTLFTPTAASSRNRAIGFPCKGMEI